MTISEPTQQPSRSENAESTEASRRWRPTRILPRDATYATFVAFLAWVFAVYDFILFGLLLPEISAEFGWSTATATGIATTVSVGTFIVAILVGPMVDRIGRRRGMIVTTAGAAVSSGLTALTMNPGWLIGVRSLSGLGYSEQAVNATYLNELYATVESDGRSRKRGLTYSLVQGGWPIGVLFASAMTALLLAPVGWRGVFVVATFPAIVIVILGRWLKESPKFEVMRRARELHRAGKAEEAAALGAEHRIDLTHSNRSPLVQLLDKGVRKHTVFLSLAFLLNWFGVQILAVLGTTVLTEGKGVTFTSSLLVLILSNAVGFVGYVAHGFIGDKIGRRETIAIGWLLSGISFTLMLLVAEGTAAVLVTYSLGLFFLIGPYSALLFYMGESYPTRIRATGASFVNAMGPIGAIFGGLLLTTLLARDIPMSTAAFVAGGLAILVSGALMLGARRIRPGDAAAG